MIRSSFSAPRRFFIQSYADPRDLHSFPTRRSSDLEDLAVLIDDVDRRHHVRMPDARGEARFVDEHVDERAIAGDRKSTRLNSSHRCISYAVFCLKKKKQIGKQNQKQTKQRTMNGTA